MLKGDPVYWRYEITNPGNVPLVNVALDDDMLDPDPLYSFGDLNDNDMLEAGETWVYFAAGTAGAGQYENIATAMADDTVGNPVSDTDPSHYFGGDPGILVEKSTNGQDADNPSGPFVPVGDDVHWVYVITNEGNVPLVDIALDDDQLDPSELIYSSGDINDNDILEVGETWIYFADGTAEEGQYTNRGHRHCRRHSRQSAL